MIVLTVDQRGSTHAEDRVPQVLDDLAQWSEGGAGLVVPFSRTVGDEVQGVLVGSDDGARLAVDLTLGLLRDQGWSIGIGVGPVELPLPAESRNGRGPAFYRARDAVERAKTRTRGTSVAVEGPDDPTGANRANEIESLLRLLGAVRARRTPQGWEAVDVLAGLDDRPGRQKAAAQALAVSEQAVSQRVRTALWQEEEAVRPLAARLLAELAGLSGPDIGPVGKPAEARGSGTTNDDVRDELRGTGTP
ncbi:hypothetical protein [Promicromonospora sp. NPDC050880]|uniref:hypothetical protein n=1 Tax=Promicromonospora sp. NPDC050880 TaxID=3364406 RepID=UPI00378A2062